MVVDTVFFPGYNFGIYTARLLQLTSAFPLDKHSRTPSSRYSMSKHEHVTRQSPKATSVGACHTFQVLDLGALGFRPSQWNPSLFHLWCVRTPRQTKTAVDQDYLTGNLENFNENTWWLLEDITHAFVNFVVNVLFNKDTDHNKAFSLLQQKFRKMLCTTGTARFLRM